MHKLSMNKISKYYPGTIALEDVDFTLNEQEIVSLLGGNGAGKTTLMKILYGMTSPSSGEIIYNGEKINFKHPIDAIEKGICMVHQHFMLVPAFTVVENIIAGSEPGDGAFVNMEKARKKVVELISRFNFNLDPDVKVEELSVGEQQRVEILKALFRNPDILILDEPTAVLTPLEVDDLFKVLRLLRKEGKSIIIITHKLKETKSIADRVVVLRNGRLIDNDVNPKEASTKDLSEMMVGREVKPLEHSRTKMPGDVKLEVSNLVVEEDGDSKVKDISFNIRSGEILGVAGIEGNGQTELIEAITGIKKPISMNLRLNGAKVSGNCIDFLKAGIGHIPEDRNLTGLVGEMPVRENMILGYHKNPEFNKRGLLREKEISVYAQNLKEKFDVKTASIDTSANSLSGGNQQKIIIARVFSSNPQAIVIAHPTRGVDIGAQEYIHEQLLELRDKGASVLLISADLDEVRSLSDRILIMYEGKIVSETMPGELDEIEMGLLMTGGDQMIEGELEW